MFTKGELRRLRKTARKLHNSGESIAWVPGFGNLEFVGGRLVSGFLKQYGTDEGYQARDGGFYQYIEERLPFGDEDDPSGFDTLFAHSPGANIFRVAGIGPYANN